MSESLDRPDSASMVPNPPCAPLSQHSASPPPHAPVQRDATECNTPANESVASSTPPEPLSAIQLNAIGMLVAGATDAQAAAHLGVNRSTVFRWRTRDAAFRAELTGQRAAIYDCHIDQVRTMLGTALDLVHRHLHDPNPAIAFRAARSILAISQIAKAFAPPDPPILPRALFSEPDAE